MDSVLDRIRELVRRGRIAFSRKAEREMDRDNLETLDVVESVLNADGIMKVVRSRSEARKKRREMLYVIHAPSGDGTWIYTKGTIRGTGEAATYYFFISSKLLE